jgi:hypothetical protein
LVSYFRLKIRDILRFELYKRESSGKILTKLNFTVSYYGVLI